MPDAPAAPGSTSSAGSSPIQFAANGAQIIGTLLARGFKLGTVKQPIEKYGLTKTGYTHELNFVAPWVGMESLIPAYYSIDPKYPALVFVQGTSEKWMGNLAKINLQYTSPDYGTGGGTGLPPDEFNESATAQEIDIQLNPRFQDPAKFTQVPYANTASDGSLLGARIYTSGVDAEGNPTKIFIGFRKGSKWCGTTSCYNGGLSVTHVSYFTSKPSRDTFVRIANVPDGYYSSSGNWLRLTSEVNKSGQWWAKRNSYLYSDKPWDTDTYATA